MKYIEYQRKHEMKMHESVTKSIILKKLASNFRNKWVFPVFVIIITFIVLAYWMIYLCTFKMQIKFISWLPAHVVHWVHVHISYCTNL